MEEPVNRWRPVTDAYKEQAARNVEAVAENEQKLKELHESNLRKPWTQAKAPLGIRIFTWYYILRAGLCAILLFVLATFPQSVVSALLFDSIGNVVHSQSRAQKDFEAREQEMEREAQANGYPSDAAAAYENPSIVTPEVMHNLVMVYLGFNMIVAAVVAFMWWNRSWKVRWVTMFYSGALVVKAAIGGMFLFTSGGASLIGPSAMSILLLTVGINALIFLYLSFGYGVKQWFEPQY